MSQRSHLTILTLAAVLALATPLLARDTVGAGFGADGSQPLPAPTALASYDTLANGDRVVYDGTLIWLEHDDGSFDHTIAGTPMPGFPSFVRVDSSETFAILGESSNGAIYRVGLSGGLVPLATIGFNFAFVFETGDATGIVSAATCSATCTNSLIRLDVTTGNTAVVATIPGPSGPVAFSPAGDLYTITQSDTFPTPPGSLDILRWSAAQVATGPYPLTPAQAVVFTHALDGGGSMAFDSQYGHLFVAASAFGSTARLLEIDRFGVVVGAAATSSDYISDVEVFDAPGDGVLAAFQPAGARLQYRTTEFVMLTSRIVRLSPRRPDLTAVQNGNDTMTISLTGMTPGSAGFVIASPVPLYSPSESGYDLGNYLLWTGMPYPAHIRRVGNQITADSSGSGSFTFANPAGIQGTRVIQVLVRDASGILRGSSTAIVN
jgi:hypothetical protein